MNTHLSFKDSQYTNTYSTAPKHTNAGLTEILLSNFDDSNLDMVLPMLAYLSRQVSPGKWFSWIAPEGVNKSLLELYGFNLANIRLIHTRTEEETLWVLWESLANGMSDVVVATCNGISKKTFRDFNVAALKGSSRGLILSCA